MLVPADIAEKDDHGVQRRVKMEQLFTEGSYLEAQITVQAGSRTRTRAKACGALVNITTPSNRRC